VRVSIITSLSRRLTTMTGSEVLRKESQQLRQTPMNKSDHNGYWAALERSKLVRLGVRNRSQ